MSGEDVRAVLYVVRRRASRALADLSAARAEIAAGSALIAGWLCITAGLAALLPRGQVWLFSAGLLLLSLFGWKFLWLVASKGLYKLNAEDERRG